MESGVPQLVQRLCECVATQCEKDYKSKRKNLLVLPAHTHKPCFPNRDSVLKHLYRTAYDLLLLRRREWYGKWASDLSPECQCLARAYVLREMGCVSDSKRLDAAICILMETVSEPQEVCQLLVSLATEPRFQVKERLFFLSDVAVILCNMETVIKGFLLVTIEGKHLPLFSEVSYSYSGMHGY